MRSLRQAVRSLAKTPALSAIIIVTLSLGIGSAVAVFTLVDGVVLRPLPFPHSDQLVQIDHTVPELGFDSLGISVALYKWYRESSRAFEEVALYQPAEVTISGQARTERYDAARVTASLFGLLRVPPAVGRGFVEAEEAPGGADVVVIGHGLWRSRFGSDPELVGKNILVNDRSHQVVGVMPESFAFPEPETALWLPRVFDSADLPLSSFSDVAIGRLAPGQTMETAHADLGLLVNGLAEAFPDEGKGLVEVGFAPALRTQLEEEIGDVKSMLWVLLAAVGLILAIAGANVANLFLVRVEARSRELAIRGALGADRKRLIFGLLRESLLLAAAAGVLGLVLAGSTIKLTLALGGSLLPRAGEIGVDLRVVLFTLGVTMVSGFVFGLLPAIRSTRSSRLAVAAGRASTAGREQHRLRGLLVISQLALGLVLAVSCGLVVRSFLALQTVNPGFQAEGAVSFRLVIPNTKTSDVAAQARFVDQVRSRLAALPGIDQVGAATYLPLSGTGAGSVYNAEGQQAEGLVKASRHLYASAGYIEAMRIPLLEGRLLVPADHQLEAPNVLVSESFARRVWGDESPIGRRITSSPFEAEQWLTVVGVVGDVKLFELHEPSPEFVYLPPVVYGQGDSRVSLVMRTDRPLDSVRPEVLSLLNDLDPSVAVSLVHPLQALVDKARSRSAFAAVMLTLAAIMALAIAAVGLYGTVSYLVGQRRKEIGIRMALGARRQQVRSWILSQGLVLASVGIGVGLLLAVAATRLLGSILHGVSELDPLSFIAMPFVLLTVAVLATWIPAWQASQVEPLQALRED